MGEVVVRYPAPHGEEIVAADEGDELSFGRGGDCALRFGFAPDVDLSVPRLAGRLCVRRGRVWVESCTEPGHRVLQVRAGGPPVGLGHGEGQAPAAPRFVVLVTGDVATYALSVTQRLESRARPDHGTADGTVSHDVSLTDRQREVIGTYLAPILRGQAEPASHRDVAAALAFSLNYVRSVLYDVYEELFAAGIPMPEHSDKRVAVVEAARLHRLVVAGDG